MKSEFITNNDLFNNTLLQEAKNSLSEEDKKKYDQIGQDLYCNIDYNNSKVLNNVPPPMIEIINYIRESLKSGLHPSMLEEKEKDILFEFCDKEWYKEFGYIKEDLKEIITIKKY